MCYKLTTKLLVQLARERYASFIVPNEEATRLVVSDSLPVVLDMSDFPNWCALRTPAQYERVTIAIASDAPALIEYAAEHGIPVLTDEDAPQYVGRQPAIYNFTGPDDIDPPPGDDPMGQTVEDAFGGMPQDYDMLPPLDRDL